MRPTSAPRAARLFRASSLIALALAFGAAGLDGRRALAGEPAAPRTEGDEVPPALPSIYAELAGLRDPELARRLERWWSEAPEPTFDALVLLAGRVPPPALSGPARAEREAARAAALLLVREQLAQSAPPARDWVEHLAALSAPEAPDALLRAAALRVAGELGLAALEPSLAAALGCDQPELRCAARHGLFALHLEWFATPDDYATFAAGRAALTAAGSDRAAAERYEALARERMLEILELDPARAALVLEDRDPRLRAAAARTLAEGVGSGALERERAEEQLFARLALEEEPLAHLAVVEALVRCATADVPGAPALERLRAELGAAVGGAHPEQLGAVARALGRLPWSTAGEVDDAHVLRGLEWLGQELEVAGAAGELADPDVLVSVLRAIGTLGELAQSGGVDLAGAAGVLNPAVLGFVESGRAVHRVRVAAALLLPFVARPGDLERVDALLARPETHTDLRYALVGALGRMARTLDPERDDFLRAVSILAEEVRSGDADLRRRALAPLLSDELAPLVAREEPELFVEWLANERLPELQSRLLELVGLYGNARDVDRLLAMPGFDALATDGAGRIGEISAVLRAMCGEDPDLRFRAAERLLALDDEGSEVRRLREALVLLSDMPRANAAGLPPERQRAIVGWSARFAERGGVALLHSDVGLDFLHRLVEVHLAQARVGDAEQSARDAWLRARALSVLGRAEPDTIARERVEAEFQLVLDYALENQDRLSPWPVHRDRARWRLLVHEREAALVDYRAVLAHEPHTDWPAAPAVLEHSDLRDFGALLAALGTAEATAEAFDLSLRLVTRATWRGEAAPARVQDLQELVARVEATNDLERLARALALFAPLPAPPEHELAATPGPTQTVPPPPLGALGQGLIEDPLRHAELVALHTRLERCAASMRAGPSVAPGSSEQVPDSDGAARNSDRSTPRSAPASDDGVRRRLEGPRSGA